MKFLITETINNYDGTPYYEYEDKEGKVVKKDKPLSYREIVNFVARATVKDETREDVNDIYPVGIKIHGSDEVELSADQITLILKRVKGIPMNPLIVGRCTEFFNAPMAKEKPEKK